MCSMVWCIYQFHDVCIQAYKAQLNLFNSFYVFSWGRKECVDCDGNAGPEQV